MGPPDAPSSLAQVAVTKPAQDPGAPPPRRTVEWVAGVAGVVVLLGLAAWVTVGSLQQDLAAYVVAGRARALGLDPYVNHRPETGAPWDGLALYRHSRFLYPPLLADLFRPLGALPYVWAKGLFSFASVGALALGLWIARAGWSAGVRAAGSGPGPGLPLGHALLAAALWPPVFVALERGQIDLLLLPLLAFAWRRRHDGPMGAGAALALAALAKPFLLLAWPLLLCARRARVVITASVALVVLMALGGAIAGPALSRSYVSHVLPRAMLYGEGGPADWLLPEDDLAATGPLDDDDEGHIRLDRGGRSFPAELGHFRRNASVVRALGGQEDPSRFVAGIVLAILGGLLARAAARHPEHPGWYWAAPLGGLAAAPVAWAMSLTLGLPLLFTASGGGTLSQQRTNLALGAAWAAGLVGVLVPTGSALAPWAWPLAALGGVAAGALAATERRGGP